MDAFTEHILARARERQKMLEGYTGNEKTPLREKNREVKTCSEPNLTDVKKTNRKEIVSDSNISSNTQCFDTTIKENKFESNLPRFTRQNSKTRVSSEIPGSPNSQLKTLNIQKENFNMEIKVSSTDNIRVEVEIEEQDDSDTGSTFSESGLRDESKSKLKRLGELYAGGDDAQISSPIHRTEAKFYASEENDVENPKKNKEVSDSAKSRKGLSRLADLAQTINEWEDDINMPPAPKPPNTSSPTKSSPSKPAQKPRAPDPPVIKNDSPVKSVMGMKTGSPANSSSPRKVETVAQVTGLTPKKLKWDQNESQGFTRTSSKSRLVYSYNSQDKNSNAEVKTAQTTHIAKTSVEVKPDTITEEEEECPKENKIKQMSAIIEEKVSARSKSPTKSNSKVIVQEKTPICPKSPSKVNIRTANIADKAAIFESSPSRNTKDPALLSVSERKALFEKNRGGALIPKAAFGMPAPVKVETTMKASSTKIVMEENVKPSSLLNKLGDGTKPSSVVSKTVENVKTVVHTPAKSGKYLAPKPPLGNKATEHNFPTTAAVQQAGGIASKMAALLENKSTISQEQIESGIKEQRQKELDMLLNRFNKPKEVIAEEIQEVREEDSDDEGDVTEETAMISEKSAQIVNKSALKPAEKRKSGGKHYSKGDSPVVTSVLDEVKRIRVSPPKAGKLYPNLSDIEATTESDHQTRSPSPDNNSSSFEENNYESDDPNTSFGREILQAVCKNQTPHKRPIYDESTASDVSSILDEMDQYLDEMSNDENSSTGPTPPKQVRHVSPGVSVFKNDLGHLLFLHFFRTNLLSHRLLSTIRVFSPKVNTPKSKFQSPVKIRTSPKKNTDLPTVVIDGDNELPLTHTVSFYRKQQNQSQTPVRQITRQPLIEESPSEVSEEDEAVQKKTAELQDEVNKQQNIISQTSQALNLCSCTPEFSGSTEQVEAERVLLVATHRRQAALHVLQRLKVEGTIRPQGQHAQNVPLEKGTLIISNIVLPLKQKYVKALAAAGGKGHHVVCLVKCGEQVVPTKLVSTVVRDVKNPDVDLCIPGTVTLHNIYSDFTVTFEVYCLQAQEEWLPHEIKYHINNKKSGNKLVTPKKSKQESRMVMPIKESPAGPQAVRTSSFALMGYVVFAVQAVNKRVWSLNNTPSMSPLDGSVEMRIACELAVSVEHRGFLTMFEDVSGFGAWHQRERKARPQDKDTLVMVCKGDKTIIRHLLSADTKEERIEWCNKFNAALTALRMWGSTQQ
ncbi:hypothetical protein NQ314_013261 [Rhamnusium bicolor]|uniref:Anillin homology domain-containing protein n=1 Tax=Rhamnusium bicolor TaxID=1586634 RepID=A0AAV8X803_9CUCU|nr:hypothetical protein NQ314_013261 [Rhamnusium bicolor]